MQGLVYMELGAHVGEVTRGRSLHLTCKRDQIKIRDYMDRQVTSPKRVTTPTWGRPPPHKQAVSLFLNTFCSLFVKCFKTVYVREYFHFLVSVNASWLKED